MCVRLSRSPCRSPITIVSPSVGIVTSLPSMFRFPTVPVSEDNMAVTLLTRSVNVSSLTFFADSAKTLVSFM